MAMAEMQHTHNAKESTRAQGLATHLAHLGLETEQPDDPTHRLFIACHPKIQFPCVNARPKVHAATANTAISGHKQPMTVCRRGPQASHNGIAARYFA